MTASKSLSDRATGLLERMLVRLEQRLEDPGDGSLTADQAFRLSASCVGLAAEIRKAAAGERKSMAGATMEERLVELRYFIEELPAGRKRELLQWLTEHMRPREAQAK